MGSFTPPIQKAPVQATGRRNGNTANPAEGGKRMAPPQFKLSAGETIQKKDLLNAEKLEEAKTYYSGKSTDFTPEVITEIQAKVGTTETGNIDDATLEAIAKFQKDNGLSVDGKLGTMSLPKLFTHGLATDDAQQSFAKDYLGMDWSKLLTAQAKGQAIVDHINKQLKAAGVPEVTINLQDLDGDSGRFSFSNWFIRLDEAFLTKDVHTEAELDDFANTIIHEARHAEQWYNMAQRLAGEGKTAEEIMTQMSLPEKIAKEAVADPIGKNTAKSLVVKGMYESVYGSGSDHRDKVLGPDGTQKEYKALPEESDAWRVGDEFNEQLKGERKQQQEEAEKKKN
jgi:peptidoglycan hydrolase-like protein with peptidoglycan-binding domain